MEPKRVLDWTIGPYRLERLIGRGGMGAVYLAHREAEDFHQKVAVKVIDVRLALEPFRERFRRERQILAGLNHPNITHLIDGGVTRDGDLYLVMEYINGVSLSEYRRQRNLDEKSCVRLFLSVCDAVAYAHQQLVVHRDIKPSNILVSEDGTPKLLDFGMAKVLTEESTLRDRTEPGLGLTPAYASPEQLRGRPASTLSDVFSLGVVLYELISGARVFDDDITPRLDPDHSPRLPTALKGDLDRIVRKAIAADPGQRYTSAEQLSADLRRYLDGRPVKAHPPTLTYRGRKFVRRHVWSVGVAAVSVLLLAGAFGFSVMQARAARRQADRADRINAFLIDMLGSPNPSWYNTLRARGKNVTVLEVLDEMGGRIDQGLAGQPDVEVELRRTIGRMYSALGQHPQARQQLEVGLATQLASSGGNDAGTARIYHALAQEDYLTLQPAKAIENARAALSILTRIGGKENRLTLMGVNNVIGVSLLSEGRPAEAEPFVLRSIEISRELFGNGGGTPVGMGVLGTVKLQQGKFDEVVKIDNEALANFRARPGGGLTAETFLPYRDLGLVCLEQLNYPCAESSLRQSLTILHDSFGTNTHYAPVVRGHLALVRGLSCHVSESERELNESIGQLEGLSGSDPLQIAQAYESLGRVELSAGELGPAEGNLRRALGVYRQRFAKDDPRTANVMGRLGETLLGMGKRDEALPLLRESYQSLLATVGPQHIWTEQAKRRLTRSETTP